LQVKIAGLASARNKQLKASGRIDKLDKVDMLTIIFAKTLFLSDRSCHPKKLKKLT